MRPRIGGTIPLALAATAAAWLPPRAAAQADSLSPALVARGDSIFHGRGAVCFSCHGPRGRGIAGLGPNLGDARWLHGDGGMEFLLRTIRTGVPKPKESAASMPPFGGVRLTDDQLRAVAAYVHSLRGAAP